VAVDGRVDLAERLADFKLTLLKDGVEVRKGGGSLVLGSPLSALAHFLDVLAALPGHPWLEAGEVVTTGTLTDAMPVRPGERWSTRIEGLDLSGFEVLLT
jgi:2-oxo-3-hexenedioate decarboxylase